MAAVLMVSSITTGASAFCYTGGTSFGATQNSWSAGCENSTACASGYDANTGSGGWNGSGSFACGDSSDCGNTAGTSTDWMGLAKQYIENCTRNEAVSNDDPAAGDQTAAPADSSANAAATEAAACSGDATAAENAGSYAAGNSCDTAVNSADDTAAAEPENSSIEQSSAATADDTGSCAMYSRPGSIIEFCRDTSGRVMQCLSGLYEVCNLSLKQFQICLPGCTVTPEDTAQPSGTTTDEGNNATAQTPDQNTTDIATDNQSIDNQSFEEQVVVLVNEQRAENGLAPLTLSAELSNVARIKSQDMRDLNYFSHTSPTYGSPFEMLTHFGISYRAAGENIAMGYKTPEAVMEAWMNSPGHRANILSASYTQIGVGYVADGSYWTQEFIG